MGRISILVYLATLTMSESAFCQEQTIFWLDTLTSDGRFIKIYTTPNNDWNNLYAEWGHSEIRNKTDLAKFEGSYLVGQTNFELSWTTNNSFVLKRGCGTGCSYILVFNIQYKVPYWIHVDITPKEMDDSDFYLEDKTLVVKFNDDEYLQVVVVDVDSGKKFKVKLTEDWARGMGTFFQVVDSLTIKDSLLSIYQKDDNGKIAKRFIKKIELK